VVGRNTKHELPTAFYKLFSLSKSIKKSSSSSKASSQIQNQSSIVPPPPSLVFALALSLAPHLANFCPFLNPGNLTFDLDHHKPPKSQNTNSKMSATNQGRQSPEPSGQSGAQQQSAPSSGQGVNDSSRNQDTSKSHIEGLSSNPKGPLDDHVKETTSKTMNNAK